MANDPLTPFRERPPLTAALRPPAIVVIVVVAAIVLGLTLGATTAHGAGPRLVRAFFLASAFSYLTVSLFDFWEHFRLERAATGRALATKVVPLGETLNHWATGLMLILFIALARPPVSPLAPRDWIVIIAPIAFWVLGWRDELVYHRRRASHREDIMHTVAHLAAAVMMSTLVAMRMVRW